MGSVSMGQEESVVCREHNESVKVVNLGSVLGFFSFFTTNLSSFTSSTGECMSEVERCVGQLTSQVSTEFLCLCLACFNLLLILLTLFCFGLGRRK